MSTEAEHFKAIAELSNSWNPQVASFLLRMYELGESKNVGYSPSTSQVGSTLIWLGERLLRQGQ